LDYLPLFHTRVALIFPNLKPPRFECSDRHANGITMHYFSDRPGLSMVVVGMLNGIGQLYKTPVVVTQSKFKDKGADHDEFVVTWGAVDQK
jgi:Haem-NO-binding